MIETCLSSSHIDQLRQRDSIGDRKVFLEPQVKPPPLIEHVQTLLDQCKTGEALRLLHAHERDFGGTFLWHRTLAFACAREHRFDEASSHLAVALSVCPHDTLTRSISQSLRAVLEGGCDYLSSYVWHATEQFAAARLSPTSNEELRQWIVQDHTLEWQSEEHDQAVHSGWQTDHVYDGEERAYEALEGVIRRTVRYALTARPRFVDELGVSIEQPFTIRLWSVVLPPNGFVVPHTHPCGDISGVYYVHVPDATSDADAGALRFVEYPAAFAPTGHRAARDYLFRPRSRTMVMFLSHLWHGTVPFANEELRICVPFDVRFRRAA
jgi:uncharacterized protein (TIGR02466 family)